MRRSFYLIIFCAFLFALSVFINIKGTFAEEFTSTNFRVLDPVIVPSAFSTSTGFQLWSNISEVALGTSTAAAFQINSGFLFYPFASSPVVTSTAGDAQANLSWTAADGFLGWDVSGYNIGQSTTSGGPYTYSSLGDVTSSSRTGLTNGTAYYFVVVVKDAFGNPIATSTQVSATPIASSSSSAGGGGGGGGGGGSPVSVTSAIFFGRAYPKTNVTLLKDAQIAATTVAGADANFQITLSNLSGGNYFFSLYGEDKDGHRSGLLTFPVSVTSGATTNISGIFLAPTIAVDKSEVKHGDNIAIFGQSAPQTQITISVNSEEEFFNKTSSDKDGVYLYNFDTSVLEMGQHLTKSKASLKGEISSFSKAVGFTVGTKNIIVSLPDKKNSKADLNGDKKVNLVDFSIAAYWYGHISPSPSSDFNGDGKVSLIDLSIMAFYWTG